MIDPYLHIHPMKLLSFVIGVIDKGMGSKTVKRVFSSIRAIVNLAIAEEGLDCSNAFAKDLLS